MFWCCFWDEILAKTKIWKVVTIFLNQTLSEIFSSTDHVPEVMASEDKSTSEAAATMLELGQQNSDQNVTEIGSYTWHKEPTYRPFETRRKLSLVIEFFDTHWFDKFFFRFNRLN